ncbi:MAG: OmpA family protein [Alphaproteobacteria bacterium]|nr:OmpA family protein [Alphaproteobacteria bacterium]
MSKRKCINTILKGVCFSLMVFSTPTFAKITLPPQDYIETIRAIDFYSNRIDNNFLASLANEYKSYALFKANYTPDYEMANYFATKALNAYHGENVRPENIYNRNLSSDSIIEISNYYEDLKHLLDSDLVFKYPQLMAEAQAKFDCWVDSESNGLSKKQSSACQSRFMKARNHLFAKLNDCNCEKNKTSKTITKKTLKKYDGKILPIPKWPNLPVIANNPPIPVIKQTVVKELTVSKQITETIARIEQSISDINAKIASNQNEFNIKSNGTKTDIDNLKNEISGLKNLIENTPQGDFDGLKAKLSELEEKLSNVSCSQEAKEETPTPESSDNEMVDEVIIEEEVIEEDSSEENNEPEEGEEEAEEYFEEEDSSEDEEPEFEVVDEEEYLEIEVNDASSNLLPYEIFFNWNDATVNPELTDELKEIAESALNSGEIIVIKGHTDASGTPAYNQKLSKKRAENVGKIIMSYGVPRDKIILQGVGSSEPKVKTKVGERNAENRRVVIK